MYFKHIFTTFFLQVLRIFEVPAEPKPECFLFVEYLKGAHVHNSKNAKWYNPVVPNRPHLKEITDHDVKYGCILVTAVEKVRLLVPDLGRPGYYWAAMHDDCLLWDERYLEDGTAEEGEKEKLNPEMFPFGGKKNIIFQVNIFVLIPMYAPS